MEHAQIPFAVPKERRPVKEDYKPAILIVDDSPTNLRAMERVLGTLDAAVLKAQSGNEALSLTLRHDFAVVMLDVQMPDMDGFEMAALMRGDEATRYVPIIFVTAISKTEECEFKGYETGAVDYLFKPVNSEILRNKVKVFLELDRQRKALEVMHARLLQNERMAALGMIGAGVAHELNNPMTGIINQVQYAKDNVPQKTRTHEVLGQALANARRCARIVENLLTYSCKTDAEKASDLGCGDVNAVVRDVLRVAQEDLAEAGVDVEVDLEPGITRVALEETRMQQIVVNLAANACDAMADCPRRELLLRTREQGEYVTLTVQDSGCGMDEKTRSQVFEPFFTTKPPGSGSGLGLWLCHSIVESAGGQMEVKSTPGQGCTFTVLIPKVKEQFLSNMHFQEVSHEKEARGSARY